MEINSDARNLEHLTLILGGREGIDELSSTSLQKLQIIRVQGMTSVGNLSRLPQLRWLWLEDQLKIKCLDLTETQLEYLAIYNCRLLTELRSLGTQTRLREVQVGRVALDLDALRDFPWPPTAKTVRIFSGSKKWNDATATALLARGLGQQAFWLS